MAQGTCHECGTDVEVAIYDDPALSGAIVLKCYDCAKEAPEGALWDVSALEEAHEGWEHDEHHPNLPSEHPLDESSDWVVQNRFRDRETYLTFLRASWDGKIPDGALDDVESPEGEHWDLFVWDSDDEEAIEEGREYLKRQREKSRLKQ